MYVLTSEIIVQTFHKQRDCLETSRETAGLTFSGVARVPGPVHHMNGCKTTHLFDLWYL